MNVYTSFILVIIGFFAGAFGGVIFIRCARQQRLAHRLVQPRVHVIRRRLPASARGKGYAQRRRQN